MTSWEPYPAKVKWTAAQDQAYAERVKAAKAASAKKQPKPSRSSSSGRKRRIVRTPAGARRYKVPIGSEIGTARNASAAQAQRDTESTNRYRSLVGGDSKAQAAVLRKVHNGALQRLSRVAYSFKSSDPNVVRLRIAVANELRRRGMNVNDYGGLGPKTKNPGPAGTWARDHARRVAARKKKAATAKKKPPAKKPTVVKKPPIKPARSAMSARKNDRRLRELSAPQLRAALRVFPKISPANRKAVARVLVQRAIELGAPHFLGQSVIEAAALPDETRTQVIELAGKWKHGWIPLDGTALASKMKGRTGGKRWWDGGAGKGGAKGRVHSGVGVPKSRAQTYGKGQVMKGNEADQARRNRLQANRNQVAGTKVVNAGQASGFKAQKRAPKLKPDFTPQQRRDIAYSQERLRGTQFGKQRVVRSSDTAGQFDAQKRNAATGKGWPHNIPDNDDLRKQYQTEKKGLHQYSPKGDYKRVKLLEDEMRKRGLLGDQSGGKRTNLIEGLSRKEIAEYNSLTGEDRYDASKKDAYAAARRSGKSHAEAMAIARGKKKPGVKGNASTLRRSVEAGRAARARKGTPPGSGSDRTAVVKSGSNREGGPKMDMSGRTTDQLETRKRALEGIAGKKQPTARQRAEYAAIKAELNTRAEQRYQAQKSRSRLTPEQLAKRGFSSGIDYEAKARGMNNQQLRQREITLDSKKHTLSANDRAELDAIRKVLDARQKNKSGKA